MTTLKKRIAQWLPDAVKPFAKRQARKLDQLLGLPQAHQRPGVVLMLHVGRCGSTVLANLLDQHPHIFWDDKLPRKAKQLYGDRLEGMDFPRWTQQQFRISGNRFYGFEFKILEDQYPKIIGMSTAEFLTVCREIGVTHYILLYRGNTLRHVVSHYASRQRGKWHASQSEKVEARVFPLDMSDITTGSSPGRPLLEYLQEVDDSHQQVRDLLQDEKMLEIEYENDIDAQGAHRGYEKICGFLGIEPVPVEVRNRKVNPFPLSEVLENFDAVEKELGETRFSWMLKDETVPVTPAPKEP